MLNNGIHLFKLHLQRSLALELLTVAYIVKCCLLLGNYNLLSILCFYWCLLSYLKCLAFYVSRYAGLKHFLKPLHQTGSIFLLS